jgi:hypothetical protein
MLGYTGEDDGSAWASFTLANGILRLSINRVKRVLMIWDPSRIPLDEMQKGATSANRKCAGRRPC